MFQGDILDTTIDELFNRGIAEVCETKKAYWVCLIEEAQQNGSALYRIDKSNREISVSLFPAMLAELEEGEEEVPIPLDEFRELIKSSNSFSK